jgi:signal transduction histidine kinase/CheY-like chemotaxis protein/predicted RNA-binding protein with RPS1 domain
MSELKTNYQGLPILQVRILSVRPNRLVVSLPDRRKGYIPRREWTWDRSVKKKLAQFKESALLNAVLLPRKNSTEFIYLSIRELEDPWKNAPAYAEGQLWVGEAINIRHSAAFIELKPGIVGILRAEEIPLLPGQTPGDALAIGDKILVEILSVDHAKRRIELSAAHPLHRPLSEDQLLAETRQFFQDSLENLQERISGLLPEPFNYMEREHYAVTPLASLSNVLVVDDNEAEGKGICQLLQKSFQSKTELKTSIAQALEALSSNDVRFDLAVVDLNLSNGENGVQAAKKMLRINPDLPVLFVSTDPLSTAYLPALENEAKRPFPFAIKESRLNNNDTQGNPVLRAIEDLQLGRIYKNPAFSALQVGGLAGRWEQRVFENVMIREKLALFLKDLALETNIEYALLLHLNTELKAVAVVAAYPPGQEDAYRRSMDGLYYSPVRDVVEEGTVYYAGRIGEEDGIRPASFFKELSFRSCYGLPIKWQGSRSPYALFVLDKRPDFFWNVISRIRLAASYIGLTIEREQFMQNFRPLQEMALRGELMSTFLHEFNNKVAPLIELVEDGALFTMEGKMKQLTDLIRQTAPGIAKVKQLAIDFGRLAKDDLEEVDINQIVAKVHGQLAAFSENKGVKLSLHTKNLPSVRAISLHVEQVLTNVMLNAIQNVAEHNLHLEQINDHAGKSESRSIQRYNSVWVSTCASPRQDTCCIVVMDSGPGVPFPDRERIFRLGVSTRREGHGLGLYISRHLMETMHGRLEWVDSIRLWGSAFAIVFPSAQLVANDART